MAWPADLPVLSNSEVGYKLRIKEEWSAALAHYHEPDSGADRHGGVRRVPRAAKLFSRSEQVQFLLCFPTCHRPYSGEASA
jgi:hypothetical protein